MAISIDMLKRNYMYVLVIVAVTGALIFALDRYMKMEGFESYKAEVQALARDGDVAKDKYQHQDVPQTTSDEAMDHVEQDDASQAKMLAQYEDVSPEDLLPSDAAADDWSNANPKGKGSLEHKNFLDAGFHVGVDTQANTLRNANYQLRSEPANPQQAVSIWSNSTMLPDPFRKEMEIGESS